jgi:hypothetical protein
MGDFAEAIYGLDGEAMGKGEDGGGLDGAAEGGGVNSEDLLAAEALGEAADLFAACIGEGDIGGAGEAILGGEDGGAVADEEDAGVGHGQAGCAGGFKFKFKCKFKYGAPGPWG